MIILYHERSPSRGAEVAPVAWLASYFQMQDAQEDAAFSLVFNLSHREKP